MQEAWWKNKQLFKILALAFILMVSFVSQADMLGDDSVYSTRAIGKLDFMFAEEQSTPVRWFDTMPWWAKLSYHDMPLLIPFIQNLFLSFSDSIFFAKLPFVLMGIGALILTYGWVSKFFSKDLALSTTLLLVLNALFLWIARQPFLEMGVIFFCSLLLFSLALFLENQRRYWWLFGASLGLVALTKYNAYFIFPTVALYILITNKAIFRRKEFYLSLIIFLCFLSPLIIYNLMMYKNTGHFDLQFARLFGQNSPWRLSGLSNNFFGNLISIWQPLAQAVSWPYFVLFVGGLAYCARFFKVYFLPLSAFVFLTIVLTFYGTSMHFLSIYTVFIAFFVAALYHGVLVKYSKRIYHLKAIRAAAIVFVFYLFIFVLNNHVLFFSSLHSNQPWLISASPSINRGVKQLDDYLEKTIKDGAIAADFDQYTHIKRGYPRLRQYLASRPNPTPQQIIIFDDNFGWFSKLWLFDRRSFYYNLPIVSMIDYMTKISPANGSKLRDLYFVKTTPFGAMEGEKFVNHNAEILEKVLKSNSFAPVEIKRRDGQVAYLVYHWRAVE